MLSYRVEENGYNHGCNVLHDLVEPWANSGRIVVGDSYFASTQSAIRLFSMGLRFIGVIKTATTGYPMQYLGRVVLPDGKGSRHGVVTHDDQAGCQLLAFVWVDRDRRYFITSCSSLATGETIERRRWRQLDRTPNAEAQRVDLSVQQPKACQVYYSACSQIDRHNRHRQSGLKLELKFRVQNWDDRVNTSIFAMVGPVDAWNMMAHIRGGSNLSTQMRGMQNERRFYESLIEQVIDNTLDSATHSTRRRRTNAELLQEETDLLTDSVPSSLQLVGVTPTKRFKKSKPTHRLQGRCLVCFLPATTVCRQCQREHPMGKHQEWICNKPGKKCMGKHIIAHHPDMIAKSDTAAVNWNNVI